MIKPYLVAVPGWEIHCLPWEKDKPSDGFMVFAVPGTVFFTAKSCVLLGGFFAAQLSISA